MKKLIFCLPIIFCCACSVYMAGAKTGTDIASVQKCTSRIQFINLGATVISSERLPDGKLIEIYQMKAEKGSAIRAIMHGLLDVSTGFAWELVGTPIEAILNEEKFITVKVTYNPEDVILKAEFI